jgi:hypothetical protein
MENQKNGFVVINGNGNSKVVKARRGSLLTSVNERAYFDNLFEGIDLQIKGIKSRINTLGVVMNQYESLCLQVETTAKTGSRCRFNTQMNRLIKFVHQQNISEKVEPHFLELSQKCLNILMLKKVS